VLRVIARMNMGGPAYQVSLLSGRLDPSRYETLLACGDVGPGEESMEFLAERYGATLERIPGLGPRVRPLDDLRALVALVGVVRRFRPDIVHTHTAKGGFLGRLAATIARRPRPLIVHTYHGHVLEGYFSPVVTRVFRLLERLAGLISDRLIGVSRATVDDLIRFRIAPRERFRLIPLGLDLDTFLAVGAARASGWGEDPGGFAAERVKFRERQGISPDEALASFVGRLAPIKRLDVLLRSIASARAAGAPIKLVIVGDGESRAALERDARDLGIADQVRFVGYARELDGVAAAADLAVLASDNEGTPVSLIEAGAAALPAVATDVGGVAEVVRPGAGLLAPPGDPEALGAAIAHLAGDAALRRSMGAQAHDHVAGSYSAERLLDDIDRLYMELVDAGS
jgi:glycosyltransferase involved in cell wall biosynthesis